MKGLAVQTDNIRDACYRSAVPLAGSGRGEETVKAAGDGRAGRLPQTLIVEDEPVIRQLTREAMETLGHRTLEASCAAEAMDLLLAQHDDIDLMLTDVRMPGDMDGAELAFTVRSRWPTIAVIVISGHFDPQLSRLPLGCGFLAKPYRFVDLSAMIDGRIGRRDLAETRRYSNR